MYVRLFVIMTWLTWVKGGSVLKRTRTHSHWVLALTAEYNYTDTRAKPDSNTVEIFGLKLFRIPQWKRPVVVNEIGRVLRFSDASL